MALCLTRKNVITIGMSIGPPCSEDRMPDTDGTYWKYVECDDCKRKEKQRKKDRERRDREKEEKTNSRWWKFRERSPWELSKDQGTVKRCQKIACSISTANEDQCVVSYESHEPSDRFMDY